MERMGATKKTKKNREENTKCCGVVGIAPYDSLTLTRKTSAQTKLTQHMYASERTVLFVRTFVFSFVRWRFLSYIFILCFWMLFYIFWCDPVQERCSCRFRMRGCMSAPPTKLNNNVCWFCCCCCCCCFRLEGPSTTQPRAKYSAANPSCGRADVQKPTTVRGE